MLSPVRKLLLTPMACKKKRHAIYRQSGKSNFKSVPRRHQDVLHLKCICYSREDAHRQTPLENVVSKRRVQVWGVNVTLGHPELRSDTISPVV
jgi:hypothetical protein